MTSARSPFLPTVARWAWIALSSASFLAALHWLLAVIRGDDANASGTVVWIVAGRCAALQLALAPFFVAMLPAGGESAAIVRRLSVVTTSFLAIPCLLFGAYVAWQLTQGAWVQRQAWIWPQRVAIALVPAAALVGLFAILSRAARGQKAQRLAWSAALVVAATAVTVADGSILPGQYPAGHLLVRGGAGAIFWSGLWLIASGVNPRRSHRRWLGLTVAAPVGLLALAASAWALQSVEERALLALTGEIGPSFALPQETFLIRELERVARGDLPPRWLPTTGNPAAAKALQRPDVLIVSVEALRADLFSPSRETRSPSRWGDLSLGPFEHHWSRSVRYASAYSPSTTTHKALLAVFTARPSFPWKQERVSLAEVLSRRGWDSFAVVWDRLVQPGTGDDAQAFRTTLSGFREVVPYPYSSSDQVVSRTLALATRKREQPFLGWVHFAPLHEPGFDGAPVSKLTPVGDAYVRSARWIFTQLGLLFDGFEQAGLRDHAVVILLGDHGEGLGEHGQNYHGLNVYDEAARVPFAWWVPLEPPRIDRRRASTLDLARTLSAVLGIEPEAASGGRWTGRDLQVRVGGSPALDHVSEFDIDYIEGVSPNTVALVDARHKLVYEAAARSINEYDLLNDPEERSPRLAIDGVRERRLLWAMLDRRPDLVARQLAEGRARGVLAAAIARARAASRPDLLGVLVALERVK